MIRQDIENYRLAIQGFAGLRIGDSDALLRELRAQFPKLQIQLFRANRIAGPEHLIFAATAAISALRQHRQRAHTLAVELLLYVSCQRQISKAIQLLGLTSNSHEAVLAAVTGETLPSGLEHGIEKTLKASKDDDVIEVTCQKKVSELMRVYNISRKSITAAQLPGEAETSVLKRLIIERSALLAVEKQ